MSSSSAVHWKNVALKSGQESLPKARSLHAGVVVSENALYIFGGFDGTTRLNDLHRYDFTSFIWTHVSPSNGIAPSPRDRLAATSHKDSLYIFGGFDGTSRVSDLWRFDTIRNAWHQVDAVSGSPPTARHSHCAVEWNGKIFIVFGYDGNYRCDVTEFNIARRTWVPISGKGTVPKPRYRSSVVVYKDSLFSFGGHDGSRHLDDLHCVDLRTNTWTLIEPLVPVGTMGPYSFRAITPSASSPPAARDSHSAVTYGDSMFVFGGSTGTARSDFFEYRFDLNAWVELQPQIQEERTDSLSNPISRFCHIAVVYRECMYIHAGYDGQSRLGDFKSYSFVENVVLDIPPPTILHDLRSYINRSDLSDVVLSTKDEDPPTEIFGHKIILARCPYFSAMFSSNMSETIQNRVELSDVSGVVLEAIIAYLYTDELITSLSSTAELMALFTAADRYGLERLKRICEQSILSTISIENACDILQSSDMVNAATLRKRAIEYVVRSYDAVVKTPGFEELARQNVELTLEIIRHQRN